MARTTRQLIADGISILKSAEVSSPRRNVEWLLSEATGLGRAGLYARLDEPVSPASAESFRAMLERRRRHEPLQHILGYTEFFGMRLNVSPDVLIPRPETEQVVEEALRLLAAVDAPRILDVGTGSGCIALAIKHERPDAKIWACDISKAALSLASSNADRHRLTIEFFQGDVLGASIREHVPGGLDLLISNPPYVAEDELDSLPVEVRGFEPHLALLAPSDPLIFYGRLGELGMDLLRANRHVVLETAADHGEKAADLLRRQGYLDVAMQRDYAGRFRILRAVRP